jgi:hypothetical protein
MCRKLALAFALSVTTAGAWAQNIQNLPDLITNGPGYENAQLGCISIPKEMRARNKSGIGVSGVCGWCSIKTICDYLSVPGADGIVDEMYKRCPKCAPEMADMVLTERRIPHLIGVTDQRTIRALTQKGIPLSRLRKTSIADLRQVTDRGIPVGIAIWCKNNFPHMVTLVGWTPAGDMWVIDPNSTNYKQITTGEWDGGWAIAIPRPLPAGSHQMTIQNGTHRQIMTFPGK